MKRKKLNEIKTEKDLQETLDDLSFRWQAVSNIEDARRRGKAILKLKNEIKFLLNEIKRRNLALSLNDNAISDNKTICNKMLRSTLAWVKRIEQRFKNV
jgi:hypothetical protein